jgi:hypothetical protein
MNTLNGTWDPKATLGRTLFVTADDNTLVANTGAGSVLTIVDSDDVCHVIGLKEAIDSVLGPLLPKNKWQSVEALTDGYAKVSISKRELHTAHIYDHLNGRGWRMAGMTAFVRGTLATKESVWAHDVV